MYWIFLFTLVCVAPFVHSNDDTYGTYFITSVLNYPNPDFSDSCSVNFIFQTLQNNNIAQVRLSSANINDQFVNVNNADSLNLDCQYFVLNNYNTINSFYATPDNRIKIISDVPIKVLIQVIIGNGNGQTIGDIYLVHPTNYLIGNKYNIKLPKATGGTSGLISLLAMDHGPDITGRFTKYVSGTAVLSTPFTLKTALGERQAIFVTDSSTSDISYLIEANNNFVVVAAVPCVDLQVAGNGFPSFSTSTCDYAAFTPLAIQDYACHSLLNGDGDIKGISSYSTNVIYELPNKVSCSSNLLVNNFQTNIVMSQDKVSVIMGKTIALNSGQFDAFASQSTFTQIRSTRLGGNRNPNFNFVTSAFLTNILDMSQAITGYVSFYNTVGGMTSLEVCGNNLNPNTFELNDQYIPNVYITQHILPNLHSYICYVIQVQPQGYNTFYSDAFYLAYISGSNDVNSQSSYGYALGFSASSLTSYYVPGYLNPGGDQNNEPTQAPPHAPTQAPSHAPTQTPPHAPPHAPTQGPPPTIASLSTTTPFPFVTTTKSSSQVQNTGLLIILSLAMFLMN